MATSGTEIMTCAWSLKCGRDQTPLPGLEMPSHQSCSLPA